MSLVRRTESVLANNSGRFWLAFSISFLVSQGWLALYFSGMPLATYRYQWMAAGNFATAETMVATIAAAVILLVARPLEKYFASRQVGSVTAAFWYLGGLVFFGVMIMGAMTPLIGGLHLTGSWIYIPAFLGMASLVSAPVAFISRWLYPKLQNRSRLAVWVIWVGLGLTSMSIVGVILFQIAMRLTY